MRKIFTLAMLCFFTVQWLGAQTVTSSTINFLELAAYEARHPELSHLCKTCPKEIENDNFEDLVNPNMPFPVNAKIKLQVSPNTGGSPTPMLVSRSPLQNFLGHIDPGGGIPPDTHGAVGINHVVTATNNYIRIHNKVGGAQVSQVTISTFTGVGSTCDPYLKFDPMAQRWVFSAIECTANGNRVILMTSNTSDPTGTWYKITWVPASTNGALLLDHPYLGFDNNMIVVSGRKFPAGYTGPILFLFKKADMYASLPITFGTNAQTIERTPSDGDAPLPVTVYEPPYSTVGNPSPGTFYILQSWNGSSIRLTTVTGTIPSAVWNTTSPVFPSGGTPWNAGAMGNAAEQMVETRKLAVNDARISCGIMMNGRIWAAHHIGFPSSGVPDRVAVQWWQIDATPGAGFGGVLQRGRVGGTVAGEYKYFPSIVVNKDEDVLIGYTASTPTTRVSSAYVTRQIITPANTTDDELIYKTGLNRYWKDFGGGRARWGDYSHSALDPVDNSLWTIQEYADQGNGAIPPDNNSRFGVWWAQVAASNTPATPLIVSTTSSLVTEGCSPANNAIDPGESVTVSFCLKNSGTGATTNLVATLLPTGGVTSPGAPQNFGVVPVGGASTCRSFTFTAAGTCGGIITASVLLQDGTTNLGTLTYTFTLGTTTAYFTENFDGVTAPALPVGWTTSQPINDGSALPWQTSTTVAVSAPNAIFSPDSNLPFDSRIESPNILVTTAGSTLSFSNNYDTEDGWDGGVLEISINGSAFQDIITAGGIFTSGAYSGAFGTGNPIAGRSAWTGSSGGWITTSILLPASTVGQNIKLRFRFTSDVNTGGVGWRVDNLALSAPSCCAGCNPVSITGQPANTITCTGGNASFTVTALGTAPTYQWQLSTTGVTGTYTNLSNGGLYSNVTTATLNITGASLAMSGYAYRAVVSNSCPSTTTSNGALLTVSNAASITSQPRDTTVCAGTNATFSITTAGSSLTYQWQVSTTGTGGPWTSLANTAPYSGVTTQTLTITNPTAALNGYAYRVVATSCSGPINSNAATLTVNSAVVITTQPVSQTVCTPANVTFTGAATGSGLTYQWQVSTNNGTTWTNIAGATTASLTLTGVTAAMSGNQYRLVVFATCNPAGINSNAAVLTVNTPVTITNQPQGTAVCGGQNATFSVTASGTGLTYQWQVSTDAGATWTNIAGATSATLTLNAVTIGMNGYQYRVVLNGACTTNLNSSAATLTVSLPVQITSQPTSKSVCETKSVSFTVVTQSFPTGSPVTYQWQESMNGGTFTNVANVTPYSGATTSTLTINPATLSLDGRRYRVVATGAACGSTTSNSVTLTVNPLPVPVLTAASYSGITPYTRSGLTVTVSPPGNYTYMWYKNNTLDPTRIGAGFDATVDDFGSYYVIVTNTATGCSNSTNTVVLRDSASNQLFIYPSPSTGKFVVRYYSNISSIVRMVNVYDAKGARVYSSSYKINNPYERMDVDLSNVEAGVYLVELVNEKGDKIKTGKVVIAR
ncbi:MAG: T9SS type A sorting domain-containing protein [Ferruginibacter sp.]